MSIESNALTNNKENKFFDEIEALMHSYNKSLNEVIEMLQNYQNVTNNSNYQTPPKQNYNNSKINRRYFITQQNQLEQIKTQTEQSKNTTVCKNTNSPNLLQKNVLKEMPIVPILPTTSLSISNLLSCQSSTSYSISNHSQIPPSFVSSNSLLISNYTPCYSMPSTSSSLTSNHSISYNQEEQQRNSQLPLLYHNLNQKSQYFIELVENDRIIENIKTNNLASTFTLINDNNLPLTEQSLPYNNQYEPKKTNTELMSNLNLQQQQDNQNSSQHWNSDYQVTLNHNMHSDSNSLLNDILFTDYDKNNHINNNPQSINNNTQFRMS